MLERIELKNFAIIDTLELDFPFGMTVFTGETGAGKSIILDAIELALGARLDSKVVKENAERCDIYLHFNIASHPQAQQWLTEHDFLDNPDECWIRRVIFAEGRSRSSINGHTCTLQMVSELGELLINIHSQHQHQLLLKREHQRDLLDAYADNEGLRHAVKLAYQNWRVIQEQIESLTALQQGDPERAAFLTYQIEELNQLELREDELTKLEQEHKQLAHSATLMAQCDHLAALLSANEHDNIIALLNQSQRILADIKNIAPTFESIDNLLNEAHIQITEASRELEHQRYQLQLNPERLHWVEERLTAIHQLARKHRIPSHDLLTFKQRCEEELVTLTDVDQQLLVLAQKKQSAEKAYFSVATQLSENRMQAAALLSQAITANIHTLGISGGQFKIEILKSRSESALSPLGIDNIEFIVSTNPGQSCQPLNKITSGGELSRISLAIQMITAKKATTPVLVFDEVDAGIGGRTADMVGKLLRELGQSIQIFCVTHLPQVAVCGHHHLRIMKITEGSQAVTQITLLNAQERIIEIARMLGGAKITEQTRAHAEEMLSEWA